ncbi:MAG TPA: nucleotide exchange factor GrpE [Patescibacteria group bacterium]|nr:nucleotide exchange factor GrpE [Patescibacteria group bacterium]
MQDDKQNSPPNQMDSQASGADHACGKCQEYLAGWKRAQADYQNLKKDMERERVEVSKFANERLLQDLLPALDQFTVAMQHAPAQSDGKGFEQWMQGLRAVEQLWEQTLRAIGLERIQTDGRFDPAIHDAAGEEVSPGKKAGEITRVLLPGWKWHDRVLRPARVMVAKEDAAAEHS